MMAELLILVLGFLTVGMLAVVAWSAWQNSRQPVRRVRAVVKRHRTREYGIDVPTNPLYILINWLGWGPGRSRISHKHLARVSGEATVLSSVDCFLTFGAEGAELELVVPQHVFMSVRDGDTGTLIYQGEVFKHFSPDSAATSSSVS